MSDSIRAHLRRARCVGRINGQPCRGKVVAAVAGTGVCGEHVGKLGAIVDALTESAGRPPGSRSASPLRPRPRR